jgi:hypothetical protein
MSDFQQFNWSLNNATAAAPMITTSYTLPLPTYAGEDPLASQRIDYLEQKVARQEERIAALEAQIEKWLDR